MIEAISIQNFKSVEKLKLDLGRITVLIGANGSGKSNILEGIAMGAAAANNKLENEFLASRGIRVTAPQLMRSAFEKESTENNVFFQLFKNEILLAIILQHDNAFPFFPWTYSSFVEDLKPGTIIAATQGMGSFEENIKFDFLLYAPENNKIRNFSEEAQIQPLGIRGEGLFKLLTYLEEDEKEEIQKHLNLIDWFDGFEIPNNLGINEKRLQIKDRYIDDSFMHLIDQRSTNEGFLFLLFYLTLIVSKYTPKFFAIDNIDNSLNPALCSKLLKVMVELAKKYDKQIILSTHNPAILDGLDLEDEEQKLYVIRRNIQGATKARLVKKTKVKEGEEPIKLSEQFMRGYLGGLNKNTF